MSVCVCAHTLSSKAFSTMVLATARRSPKVSLSKVVPLGRPSNRNMSSQWSWDRCSPRTYFSTGTMFYTCRWTWSLKWDLHSCQVLCQRSQLNPQQASLFLFGRVTECIQLLLLYTFKSPENKTFWCDDYGAFLLVTHTQVHPGQNCIYIYIHTQFYIYIFKNK